MQGLGIMILIQDWVNSPVSSIHLLSSDIPKFAEEVKDTPIGAPEVREVHSDRELSKLRGNPVGVWLEKDRTESYP
jgi:hypothetical protein